MALAAMARAPGCHAPAGEGPALNSSAEGWVMEAGCDRRIVRRMPRLQVYLPDDLYEQVKSRHLPASELLQAAVRAELRRQDLLAETDAYLADLIAEVGEPTAKDLARAEAIAREIAARHAVQAS